MVREFESDQVLRDASKGEERERGIRGNSLFLSRTVSPTFGSSESRRSGIEQVLRDEGRRGRRGTEQRGSRRRRRERPGEKKRK